jgi:iron complex outermembrane recepter protein
MKTMLFLLLSFNLYASVEKLETIEVTHQGTANTLVDFVPGVTTLRQNELKKRREISLGDTLRNEAGVQSTSYGPNAGRPIIRGLEGDRIRVLQNGLGVLDASSQSVDHAVPVDTLVIDSIEVVRGPMSLLYGSSAVGGVVNVNTNRIHSAFEEGTVSEILLQGDSSQDAVTTGAKIDHGKNNWMFHLDGGYRNANDLRIPGKARSEKLRQTDPSTDEAEDKLPNSGSVQKSLAVGLSKIFDQGYVGGSYYFFDNYYGAVAEEDVDIRMIQNRVEFHGEYKLGGNIFNSVKFKTAQSDYGHKELEGGEVGTTFTNEGNESRLELLSSSGNVKGVSGFQTQMFNFSAVGDEAYLPTSKNRILAAFTLQELQAGKNTFSAGLRMENFHIHDQSSDGKKRNYNGYNGSLGYRRKLTGTLTSNISVSYTERAPNFQELFADGGHVATNTFEQGNDEMNKEKAYALDVGLDYHYNQSFAHVSFFMQEFRDYIALFDTGNPSGEPDFGNIFQFDQVDAVFYGFEFDSRSRISDSSWFGILKADYVRAKEKDSGDNLPRISAPRLIIGLERVKDRWTWDVEAQRYFEQTKTAPNEYRTDAFTLLNAGFVYDVIQAKGKFSFFGRLKNLLNEEARQHTSTLKEIAPMAGRHVVAGVQYLY